MKPTQDGTTIWQRPSEVAREFQKSRQTIWEWCRTGLYCLSAIAANATQKADG